MPSAMERRRMQPTMMPIRAPILSVTAPVVGFVVATLVLKEPVEDVGENDTAATPILLVNVLA